MRKILLAAALPLLAFAQAPADLPLKSVTVTLTLKSGDTEAINAVGRELAAKGAKIDLHIATTQTGEAAGQPVYSAPALTLTAAFSAPTRAQATLPALDCGRYLGRHAITSCSLQTTEAYGKP